MLLPVVARTRLATRSRLPKVPTVAAMTTQFAQEPSCPNQWQEPEACRRSGSRHMLHERPISGAYRLAEGVPLPYALCCRDPLCW